MELRARATPFVTAEVGFQKDEQFFGWRRRHGKWQESSFGLFFANFWSPRLEGEPFVEWSWWSLLKTSHTKARFLSSPPDTEWKYHLFLLSPVKDVDWLDALDAEVTVGAFFGGLQLGVRPGELLDFVAGIFTLDLAGDDGGAEAGAPESSVSQPDSGTPANSSPRGGGRPPPHRPPGGVLPLLGAR